MNTYGYARVSSTDQNEERQLIALHQARVANRNIYVDKQSGKEFCIDQGRRKHSSAVFGIKRRAAGRPHSIYLF